MALFSQREVSSTSPARGCLVFPTVAGEKLIALSAEDHCINNRFCGRSSERRGQQNLVAVGCQMHSIRVIYSTPTKSPSKSGAFRIEPGLL